jgi:TPR repeat protein
LLRWMLLLGALGFSQAAAALEPEDLPFGTYLDLVDCLRDQDTAACEAAASAVDDPAWAALLRGRGGADLPAQDRHRWRALACAGEDAKACSALAAEDLASDEPMTRYRGAAEALRACALGDVVGCGIVGGAGSLAADASAWSRVLAGPTDDDAMKKAAKACATSKTPGIDCADLARTAFTGSDSRSALDEARASAEALCAKDDHSAACAMVLDLGEPEGPFTPDLATSLRLAEALCTEDEVGRACTMASGLLALGRFTPHGTLPSLSYQQLACNAGEKTGCQHITEVLRSERLPTFQSRCDTATSGDEDPRACTMVSIALQFGVTLAKDEARATQVEADACEHGDPSACLWKADKAWADNELEAYRWYRSACDAGSGLACGIVGRMELKGESGLTADPTTGATHLDRGVSLGSPYAMLIRGNHYIDLDQPAMAQPLYNRACALGDIVACGSTAVMVMFRYASTINIADAQQIAIAACNRDDFYSCGYLATLWTDKESPVPRDEGRARWAAGKACQGSAEYEEDDDEEACKLLTELGPGPTIEESGRTLPHLRLGGSFSTGQWAAAYDPEPAPDVIHNPRPSPGPGPGPVHLGDASGVWLMGSYGSQRSWTAQSQASALRLSFGLPVRLLFLGADLDLVTDSRLHPKVTRTYWRTSGFLNVGLALPFSDNVKFELGVGPGLGGFRAGPGDSQKIALSYGLHELVQLRVQFDDFTLGLRVEEHQLWNQGTPGIDHITGVYGLVGVAFE